MNYPGTLPQNENINAVMLDQRPGAPDAYQQQQSLQQVAQNQEVQADSMDSQKIAGIMNAARAMAAQQSTTENKAQALMLSTAAEIQGAAGQGGAKMLLSQDDPAEIYRRIYG